MQKLTREEVAKKSLSRASTHPIVTLLHTLEIGEGVEVREEEWTKKTKIGMYVSSSFRGEKKFSTKKIEGGYVIIRIK